MEREKGIVKKIFEAIGQSIYEKKDGKVSSTRVERRFCTFMRIRLDCLPTQG